RKEMVERIARNTDRYRIRHARRAASSSAFKRNTCVALRIVSPVLNLNLNGAAGKLWSIGEHWSIGLHPCNNVRSGAVLPAMIRGILRALAGQRGQCVIGPDDLDKAEHCECNRNHDQSECDDEFDRGLAFPVPSHINSLSPACARKRGGSPS